MLNWSFWWIELGIVHGSRLDLLMTSILSLFGVFYFLPFDSDYTCQATGICAHEQTRAIPFPRENRITFFLFFFLLSLGHLYTCMRVKNGEERK